MVFDIKDKLNCICEIVLFNSSKRQYIETIEGQKGVFDNFYMPFLEFFGENIFGFFESLKLIIPIQFNKKKIIGSALASLKQDLINISIKTLITELYSKKQSGLLVGDDSIQRYNCFNNLFLSKVEILNIINKYPVLGYLIYIKIFSKINLILESIKHLINDNKLLYSKLYKDFSLIDDIIFSSGDSHNGGKSVLIFLSVQGDKVVYKPHTLLPEESFSNIINWINNKNILNVPLKNALSINCKSYGWQEFIEYKTCRNKSEIEKYFYRIGVYLAVFYVLKCGDLHHENIIAQSEYPIFVDLETLITNQNIDLDDTLFGAFSYEIANSVLGSMLLPQRLSNSLLDIDISGLTGQGGIRSEKIVAHKLINIGTDEIKLVPNFVVTEENKNKATLNNNKVDPYDFCNYIIAGFSDCYKIFIKYNNEFSYLISNGRLIQGSYRQILRATQIYAKFIEAAYHPKYLKSMDDRYKLMSYFYNSENGAKDIDLKLKTRIEKEIESLVADDIPYFCCDLKTRKLYSNNKECIDEYFDKPINEQLIRIIGELNIQDMRRQLSYIKMSLATTQIVNWGKEDQLNNNSTNNIIFSDDLSFLGLAKQIGDYFYQNAIWNKAHDRCTWQTLSVYNECLKQEPINFSLYDGGGILLFLAFLGNETSDSRYIGLAKSTLAGIEELWHDSPQSNRPISAFFGVASSMYIYYNLSILWQDKSLYQKYIDKAKELLNYEIKSEIELDFIGGIAGVLVCCINIFIENKDDTLINIAIKYGEILFNKITCSKELLTGLAHGYAGIALSMILLGKHINNNDYIALGLKLVELENSHYDQVNNNWNDLRSKESNYSSVYWCHGAAGIGLARIIMKRTLGLATPECIEIDIKNSLKKIVSDGLRKNQNHSLCHGAFGNIDILIEISRGLDDKELFNMIYSYVNDILNNIFCYGIRNGLGSTGEILGLMLGLSGIGYTFIRLNNPEYPSILSLNVIRDRGINI